MTRLRLPACPVLLFLLAGVIAVGMKIASFADSGPLP